MSTHIRQTLFTRDTATLIWVLLVAATGITWWVGARHGIGTTGVASTVLIVTAMVKVWLVGDYFMDARALPPVLKRIYWVWIVTTASMLIIMVNIS